MSTEPGQKLPDKKIPGVVMLIGTFEVVVALLGLVILLLAGHFDTTTLVFLILVSIYGAMGAGLWAIQEWARAANVALHLIAIPYTTYTTLFLDGPANWKAAVQLLIAGVIVFALTRPAIRHKFQTVVPRQRH